MIPVGSGNSWPIDKAFVEKISYSGQEQQWQDPHAAATCPEQAAEQQTAQSTAKQATHKSATETASWLLGCLLSLLTESTWG